MTIIESRVSVLKLNDVGKRSLYLAITLFDLTFWWQYWPRPVAGQKVITFGLRKIGTRIATFGLHKAGAK